MPGCRDSVISDFCWAEACEPGSNISIATAPAQALHILFFIVHLLRRLVDASGGDALMY